MALVPYQEDKAETFLILEKLLSDTCREPEETTMDHRSGGLQRVEEKASSKSPDQITCGRFNNINKNMSDVEFRKHSEQEPSVVYTTQPTPGGMSPPQYSPPWSGYPPPAASPAPLLPQHQQQPPQYPMMPGNQQMHTTNNIIITSQPGVAGRPPQREWSSGVCDCCSDMNVCMMGWCCPLCLECSIAQDMGDPCCDACCLICCAPAVLFSLRAHMRGKENIRGTLFDDFNRTAGCCSCLYVCILCQLAREVKIVKAAKGYV